MDPEGDIPAALTSVLNGDPHARAAFTRLPEADQRRHVAAIEAADSDASREQRLIEILQELRGG
jgi:uncharacterized protein YdeI (YjbR/CyaY-like superfamily)